MPTQTSTDRIVKEIVLKAPRTRVWRALTDTAEFGAWFGARLQGQFKPGTQVKGQMTIPGHEEKVFDCVVDRVEPENLFSYRWHPCSGDPKADHSNEPRTLVEFRLEDIPNGTKLTVIESGFDALPASRREVAFRANTGGWDVQLGNVQRYVDARVLDSQNAARK